METKAEIQVWAGLSLGLETGDWRSHQLIFRKSGKFQVYCEERLMVETVNMEKPQCRSVYVIKHSKKRRKLSLKLCNKCGR